MSISLVSVASDLLFINLGKRVAFTSLPDCSCILRRFLADLKSFENIVSLSNCFEMSVDTPFRDGNLPLRPGDEVSFGFGLLNKLRGASPGSRLRFANAYLRKSDVRFDSI